MADAVQFAYHLAGAIGLGALALLIALALVAVAVRAICRTGGA